MSTSETLESKVTPVWSFGPAIGAVAAVVLAIVAGLAMTGRGFGPAPQAPVAAPVAATGETTEVTVHATGDWAFEPSSIDVPAGNRLVITLVNDDPVSGHDLVVGDASTSRVAPGGSEVLDAGVIGQSVTGRCSVAGHEQMGMTLQINAVGGGNAAGGGAGTEGSSEGSEPAGHDAGAHASSPLIPDDPDAVISSPIDARLEPLGEDSPTTHKVTLTVSEVPLEVAPGLYQTRWTFGGDTVGPTLRGKVGDTFEITLVNDGTIGHSIDFHAGALAPDGPMRTIAPGETLVYRFTAERAGIWMYHCSTSPMSTHIAAGMHGAVIIEPEDLDPVDHEFVVVQSEVYLANEAHSAAEAQEVSAADIGMTPPSRTVFNGIANQYVQEPLTVGVGERVRFWVLDAGPNVPLSFHIVGGQFDTVWTEGTYTIRRGQASDGVTEHAGAQVLPLLPAQGGFVELTFPEEGNYSFVNHMMSEAERGAKGIVHVENEGPR